MSANDKLAATFHPHTTARVIDLTEYPLDDQTVTITTRAQPIINAMLADAWDAGRSAGVPYSVGYTDDNPYRSTP